MSVCFKFDFIMVKKNKYGKNKNLDSGYLQLPFFWFIINSKLFVIVKIPYI